MKKNRPEKVKKLVLILVFIFNTSATWPQDNDGNIEEETVNSVETQLDAILYPEIPSEPYKYEDFREDLVFGIHSSLQLKSLKESDLIQIGGELGIPLGSRMNLMLGFLTSINNFVTSSTERYEKSSDGFTGYFSLETMINDYMFFVTGLGNRYLRTSINPNFSGSANQITGIPGISLNQNTYNSDVNDEHILVMRLGAGINLDLFNLDLGAPDFLYGVSWKFLVGYEISMFEIYSDKTYISDVPANGIFYQINFGYYF